MRHQHSTAFVSSRRQSLFSGWTERLALALFAFVIAGRTQTGIAQEAPQLPADPVATSGLLNEAGQPVEPIHPLARTASWQIVGARSFPPDIIREHVGEHGDFVTRSYPDTPPQELLPIVRELVEKGYQQAGFIEARVETEVHADDQCLVIRIDEGPRYLSGDIRVSGAATLSAEALRQWCLSPAAAPEHDVVLEVDAASKPVQIRKANGTLAAGDKFEKPQDVPAKPLWTIGESRSLQQHKDQKFQQALTRAFHDLGYYQPTFTFDVVPDRASRTLQLVVNITDEGPRGRVRNVVIRGLNRFEESDVRAVLKVDSGQPVGRDLQQHVIRSLEQTGRFIFVHCVLAPELFDAEQVDVLVDLREAPFAESLMAPYSQTEQVLLRTAEWFNSRDHGGFEVDIEIEPEAVRHFVNAIAGERFDAWQPLQSILPTAPLRIVIAPRGDFLLETKLSKVGSGTPLEIEIPFQLVSTRGDLLLTCGTLQRHFVVPARESTLSIQAVLTGVPRNPEGREVGINFGAKMVPASAGITGHQLSCTPFSLLRECHQGLSVVSESDAEKIVLVRRLDVASSTPELQRGTRSESEGPDADKLVPAPTQSGAEHPSPEVRLEIDRVTGRPLKLQAPWLRLRTVRDGIATEHEILLRTFAANRVQPEPLDFTKLFSDHIQPMLPLIAGRVESLLAEAGHPDAAASLRTVVKLADPRVWQPLWKHWPDEGHAQVEQANNNAPKFFIPLADVQAAAVQQAFVMNMAQAALRGHQTDNKVAAALQTLSSVALPFLLHQAVIFPEGSGAWQVHRDLQLGLRNRPLGLQKLTSTLQSDAAGPVTGMYAAMAVVVISKPHQAALAAQSLERIDHFAADHEWLLSRDAVPGRILRTAAESFRRMDDQQVAAAIGHLTGLPVTRRDGAAIRATLPADLAESLEPALPAFVDALWAVAFKQVVTEQLENLSLSSQPPTALLSRLFNLGEQHLQAGRHHIARRYYQRSLAITQALRQAVQQSGNVTDQQQLDRARAFVLTRISNAHDFGGMPESELPAIQHDLKEAVEAWTQFAALDGVKPASATNAPITGPGMGNDLDGQIHGTLMQLHTRLAIACNTRHVDGDIAASREHCLRTLALADALSEWADSSQELPNREVLVTQVKFARCIAQSMLAAHLLTPEGEQMADPQAARDLALQAVGWTNSKEHLPLAVLAAAYAALGDFEKAMESQQRAIEVSDAKYHAGYRQRLATYEAGRIPAESATALPLLTIPITPEP